MTTETTTRIAKYQNIIAEAYGQQAEHYRGAEYAAAMGLIRAAIVSVVSTDMAKLERVADVLAALDAVRDAAHRESTQPEPPKSDAELHATRTHPDYEYATTKGPRKAWDRADEPPDGEGWERNIHAGHPGEGWERFDYHEESYWMRPRAAHRESTR